MGLKGKDLLTISDLSVEEIELKIKERGSRIVFIDFGDFDISVYIFLFQDLNNLNKSKCKSSIILSI